MASPPLIFQVNDIIECQILGRFYGEPNMIVNHFRAKQASTPTGGFNSHLTGYAVNLGNCTNNFQKWRGFRYRRIRPEPITDFGVVNWAEFANGWSGDAMPAQVCHLIKLRTALSAPAGRGRIYIPGVPISHWTTNAWNNNGITGANNLANWIMQWFRAGGQSEWIEMGVVSWQTSPITYNAVTGTGFAQYPAIRRSRKPVIL